MNEICFTPRTKFWLWSICKTRRYHKSKLLLDNEGLWTVEVTESQTRISSKELSTFNRLG